MNIKQGQFHQHHYLSHIKKKRRKAFLKTIGTWLLMTALMFGMAYLFLIGWDLQESIDAVKRAAHMDTLLYPEPPVKVYVPKPTDKAEPKVRYFQDASQPKGGK